MKILILTFPCFPLTLPSTLPSHFRFMRCTCRCCICLCPPLAWLGIQWRFFKFVRTVRVFNSCATISTIIVNHGVIRGTNARIEVLFDVVESLKLVALNDGRTTPVHPGVNDSVPDVTFTAPVSQSRVLWHLEPDLWGSDHPPIRLTPTRSSPSIVHFHRVHMRCLSPKTA